MVYSTESNFKFPEIVFAGEGEKREYILVEDYTFEWSKSSQRFRITVPKGYNTDLASVPKMLGVSGALGFTPYGPCEGAAIIHDFIYQMAAKTGKLPAGSYELGIKTGIWIADPTKYERTVEKIDWIPATTTWKRIDADRLYEKMCVLGGMPRWKAAIEFRALRMGAFSLRNGLSWYLS